MATKPKKTAIKTAVAKPKKTAQKTKATTKKTTNSTKAKKTKQQKNTSKKPKQQVKIVKKSQGKSPNSQKNSAKTAVSTSPTEEVVTIIIKTHNDTKGGHPHIIIDDVDNKHVSVGLTSDAYKGKGHKNICLKINPLGGSDPSYMKRQGTVAEVARYGSPRNGSLAKSDHEKAKQIGDKAKQKYLKNKKKP